MNPNDQIISCVQRYNSGYWNRDFYADNLSQIAQSIALEAYFRSLGLVTIPSATLEVEVINPSKPGNYLRYAFDSPEAEELRANRTTHTIIMTVRAYAQSLKAEKDY